MENVPGHAPSLPRRSEAKAGDILQPRRILVRGVNWLGDAVMTTPALMRLRERFPDAHLALLTPEKLKDLWLHHPAIDEIVTFRDSDDIWEVARRIRLHPHAFKKQMENYAELGRNFLEADTPQILSSTERILVSADPVFDLALVLPNSPRSALEVWLARIPQRIGYARPWRNFFLTQTVTARPDAVKMRKRSTSEIRKLISSPPPPAPRHSSRTP